MKFLIDAQLPRRLAAILTAAGHNTIHTLELPLSNRTPDHEIAAIAAREGRVVVTKDSDFVTTFLLNQGPPKLLLLSTGNISNNALLQLIADNLQPVESALSQHAFVELSRTALTIHS